MLIILASMMVIVGAIGKAGNIYAFKMMENTTRLVDNQVNSLVIITILMATHQLQFV